MAHTSQDIGKRFSASLKGVKIKVFPLKNWHLKFSSLSFPKFAIFAKFSKNHVLSLLLMSGLPLPMVHSDLFIFDNVIHITLKEPSNRLSLSIGSLNGKNRLSEGHLILFLSDFPF